MFVTPETEKVMITTSGVSQSRWPVEIRNSVVGKVKDSKVDIQPGTFVKKGQLLALVEDTEHKANLAQAETRVAQAELELARLRHEQTVLEKINSQQKQTPYDRLEPHVTSAKAELNAAQMALSAAQIKLDETRVTAPFDALILGKHLAPGQWLNHGELMYQLADRRFLDVRAELTQYQWQQLSGGAEINQVNITDDMGSSFVAHIRYIEPALNAITRQQGIILEITKPFDSPTPLMSGQQYKVQILGKEMNNVVVAPASVLTRNMTVWTVENGELKQEAVDLLDEQASELKFRFKSKPELHRNLVLFPLSTMLDGQAVAIEPSANSLGA